MGSKLTTLSSPEPSRRVASLPAVRAFRFGLQVNPSDAGDLRDKARAAEAAGFDIIHTFDHVGDRWAPLAPLMAAAAVTDHIRLCPLVLNNDFHHPVHLARELAALDHFSDGRVELGIGAGHAFTEYAAIGAAFDAPAIRKARLAEAVECLRDLLGGDAVTFEGDHYQLRGVRTMRSLQPRIPFLVAVNGRKALAHAARHADTIGLTMLGRTLEDGRRHEPRWQADRLDATVRHIHDRAPPGQIPELNALVQVVVVTDDREQAAREIIAEIPDLSLEDALATPFLALGTYDEIAGHLRSCRERWGISYYSVRSVESFAPVIERLRAS